MTKRHGFTLFEIIISLMLLVMGVLTTLSLMPSGIKSQQQARFAAYASAKVMDMMEMFNCQVPRDQQVDGEVTNPWETTVGSRVLTHDLEARLATSRAGLIPLPDTIAKRLDSAGDEIAQLLGAGGRIYYALPGVTMDYNSADEVKLPRPPGSPPDAEDEFARRSNTSISEARRMLVGFVGYPQQNSIPVFPWKAWPYYHGYPAPPLASSNYETRSAADPNADDDLNAELWLSKKYTTYRKYETGGYNQGPGGTASSLNPPTKRDCLDYAALAMWYAQLRGLPASFCNGTATDADVESYCNNADHVRVLSHLAHATTCLTKWFWLSGATGAPTSAGSATAAAAAVDPNPAVTGFLDLGFDIPARTVVVNGVITRSTPQFRVDLDKIRNWHQRSLDMIMKHAASYPYSWGTPRPYNRSIMMDVPLLEWDLFPTAGSPLLTGTIDKSGGVVANHYRALAPMAISFNGVHVPDPVLANSKLGAAIAASDQPLVPGAIFGDISHYTLARPFDPSERCRQVVFWMADWQSYEDFETAPSAPVDASKYPFLANRSTFGQRMTDGNGLFNPEYQTSYFNPERNLVLHSDVSGWATRADITSLRYWRSFGSSFVPGAKSWDEGAYPFECADGGTQTARRLVDADSPAPAVFSGVFGADRNGNGILDRGPLPASVRQRAVTVARFVVYDPRLPLVLR